MTTDPPGPAFDRYLAEVEREALRLWRKREAAFPASARRLTPDALDLATGAWGMVLVEAKRRLQQDRLL